jgi:hypothetical protein
VAALTDPETLIIFTTSPTGLGHIRVMNALAEGLTPGTDNVIMGLTNINANKIHALGSRIPFFLNITEFVQNNRFPESVITGIYANYFSSLTKSLKQELDKTRGDFPKKKIFVIVSTHFSLAYPVCAIKKSFFESTGIHIFNALIVTDDSPQQVWAVDKSDIIFVPSDYTALKLKSFLPSDTKTIVETISFPVSPRLSAKLPVHELELIEDQLDPKSGRNLHIVVPVSGAAVQLTLLQKTIEILARDKFIFTVIGQNSSFTNAFFDKLKNIPRVQLSAGESARQTVNFYASSFFQSNRPAVEITKPSEQAFKAILRPNERGGVILLLTSPIGRQERDNMNFLIRHALMPSPEEQAVLEEYLINENITEDAKSNLFYRASHWRALKLPEDPEKAAKFIKRAKDKGILYTMLSYVSEDKRDLRSDGVAQVWNRIENMLKANS